MNRLMIYARNVLRTQNYTHEKNHKNRFFIHFLLFMSECVMMKGFSFGCLVLKIPQIVKEICIMSEKYNFFFFKRNVLYF